MNIRPIQIPSIGSIFNKPIGVPTSTISPVPITLPTTAPSIFTPPVISPAPVPISSSSITPSIFTPPVISPAPVPISSSSITPSIFTPPVISPAAVPISSSSITPSIFTPPIPSSSQPSTSSFVQFSQPSSSFNVPKEEIRPIKVSTFLTEEEWETQLLAYVENNILSFLFPQPVDRMKLMGISESGSARAGFWIQAFLDPTIGDKNYEVEEKLGDGLLKCLLINLFIKLYKNFGPDEISKMVAYYGSNIVFADIVKTVFPELINYIKVDPRIQINDAIIADVFEANVAAIFNASENQIRGLGYINCEKFLTHVIVNWFKLSGKNGFDERQRRGDFKTQVGQIFSRNSVHPPRENVGDVVFLDSRGVSTIDKSKKRITVEFVYAREFTHQKGKSYNQIGFLRKYNAKTSRGFFLETKTVKFEGIGNSKVEASNIAYGKAYEWLFDLEVDSPVYKGKRVKVSITWAEQVKGKSDVEIFPKEYTDPLYQKLAEDNLDFITFDKIGKHVIEGQQFVVRMMGWRGDVSKHLSTGVSKGDHIRARRDAIEIYIGKVITLPPNHKFKFTKNTD